MRRTSVTTALAAMTMVLVVLPHVPAAAATISVNSVADTAANDGSCTLREAITAANTNTASGAMPGECVAGSPSPTVDTVAFSIPGADPHTIQPGSALPTITEPVVIDGYTEPGASPNTMATATNAVLMIELNGQVAGGVNGLTITAGGTTVRGLVINRFNGDAIRVTTTGGNTIEGNFLGTDIGGGVDLGNSSHGVAIDGAPTNTIGGTAPAAWNVISGNDNSGALISGVAATGNALRGNLIGTNAAGTSALGNGLSGLTMFQAPNNTISGNLISGNDWDGVTIIRPEAAGNVLQGNRIGTNAGGTAPLGNGVNGVFIWQGPNNTIGGTAPGEGNLVSGNAAKGVVVGDATAVTNRILGNDIGANGDVGIDLGGTIDPGGDGVTSNDPGDVDTGPNEFQNFPDLSWAVVGGSTTVAGTLRSEPNGSYRIEVFSSPSADPSGNGEGGTFLGATEVATDGSGNASFVVTVGATVPAGHVVTSTATELQAGVPASTSEFSKALPFPSPCTIPGTPGDDVLQGTAGDDVICGEGGDDVLIGLGGNDALLGGPGTDTASYAGTAAMVTADLRSSLASDDGDGGADALIRIERLVGSRFPDSLKGDGSKNRLVGRAGGDLLAGRSGRDVLLGRGGTDRVKGGGGRDLLKGGADADRLFGQGGPDLLQGQGGDDRLDGGGSRKDRCRQGPGIGVVRRCER